MPRQKRPLQSVPYRLELAPVAPELVSARDAALESVLSKVQRIAAEPRMSGPGRMSAPIAIMIQEVLDAPFEGVQVAFASLDCLRPGVLEQVIQPLVRQAVRQADGEGVVWTPLLEALAERGLWRTVSPRPGARLALLAPWISAQADGAALWPLTRFLSDPVATVLAGHISATALTPAFVEWALRHPHMEVARALWSNPRLGAGELETIAETAVDFLVRPPGAPLYRELEGFFLSSVFNGAGRSVALAADQVEGLRAAASTPRASRERTQGSPGHVIDVVLFMNPTTPEEVLREALGRSPAFATHWTLVAHPNAPLEHLRTIARGGRRDQWAIIARNPRAMRDEEIRGMLAESASTPVMRAFVLAASPETQAADFRRFLARHPEAALDLWLEGGLPEAAAVDMPLAGLLAHAKQAVRMKAFLAMSSIKGQESADAVAVRPASL